MAAEVAARKDQYVGETRRFLRDGFGVYNYGNKFFRYEGEWKKGRKHGHGKLIMADGTYYEGQFKDGEIEGHGYKYFAVSGSAYSGEFYQGEQHGQGVMKYKDGSIYEGEWRRNKRQGYGSWRTPDNCVHEGFYHEHRKHGEGAQTYLNGDRYDGDWVQGKRQGHGELRQIDGTIYDGQWRQDMMNGQGRMLHCSGCIYEGLWSNNKPVRMANKLVIVIESSEMDQDSPFSIRVECTNEDGELIEEDRGRELQVSAGYKWTPPKSPAKEGSGLFNVIEDMEESPIPTSFGYDVASYPLTDRLPDPTMEGEGITEEQANETEGEKDDNLTEKETELKAEPLVSPAPDSVHAAEDTGEGQSAEDTSDMAGLPLGDGTPLPPPVINKRTEQGVCSWEKLHLAPPPPMYRPFTLSDLDLGKRRATKPALEKGVEKKAADSNDKAEDKSKVKKPEDTLFARPGEYVLMVHDVTSPAFLGISLQPAFLLLKLRKKKKTPQKKETKPKWDTRQHIAQSMRSDV